jgi:hypothetical protein
MVVHNVTKRIYSYPSKIIFLPPLASESTNDVCIFGYTSSFFYDYKLYQIPTGGKKSVLVGHHCQTRFRNTDVSCVTLKDFLATVCYPFNVTGRSIAAFQSVDNSTQFFENLNWLKERYKRVAKKIFLSSGLWKIDVYRSIKVTGSPPFFHKIFLYSTIVSKNVQRHRRLAKFGVFPWLYPFRVCRRVTESWNSRTRKLFW